MAGQLDNRYGDRDSKPITGVAAPTTSTHGYLGQVRFDTNGNRWKLIGIIGSVYYWVINGKSISVLAGEVITAGSFCYVGSDGKAYLSDNTTVSSAKSKGFIFRAMNAAINIDNVIIGCYSGGIVTSGLTTGDIYYLSTAGAITNTIPSTAGHTIRIIGYAISETMLMIDIDNTYLVV